VKREYTANPVLETTRLFLRELSSEADGDFIARLLAHPEVMRYWPQPFTREEADAWIEKQLGRYERDGCGYWLVSLRETGEPFGQAGVMMIEIDDVIEPGLGYIIDFSAWGNGYATEAAAACVSYAFNTLGSDHIVAPIRPANAVSARVAEKVGMIRDKTTMYAGLEHLIYSVKR